VRALMIAVAVLVMGRRLVVDRAGVGIRADQRQPEHQRQDDPQ
jgi:hypothetical protein